MKFLGLGLQGKFVVALLVAAALPFLIGLAVFETSGFRYFMEERGKYHHMEAMSLSHALDEEADNHGEMLQLWLSAETALMECVLRKNHEISGMATDDLVRHKRVLDEMWPTLSEDDPQLTEVLRNEGALSLMRFQDLNPEVAEVLATDANGCLIAATGKSTDYDQADENWWYQGKALGDHERWTDILHLDASSGVFSQDVILPLHHNGVFAGVMKISVDVTSLFTRLGAYKSHANERWQIVLEDGGIVASSEEEIVPLMNRVPDQTRHAIQQNDGGWILTQDPKGDAWLTGFAALKSSADTHGARILFSSPRDEVVAPLQKRFLQVGALAILFLACCTLAGYWMIHYQVLRPLNVLARAARSVCDTVRIRPGLPPDKGDLKKQREIAMRDLHAICVMRSGDEIEPLANDIAAMSERLLRDHDDLEADATSSAVT